MYLRTLYTSLLYFGVAYLCTWDFHFWAGGALFLIFLRKTVTGPEKMKLRASTVGEPHGRPMIMLTDDCAATLFHIFSTSSSLPGRVSSGRAVFHAVFPSKLGHPDSMQAAAVRAQLTGQRIGQPYHLGRTLLHILSTSGSCQAAVSSSAIPLDFSPLLSKFLQRGGRGRGRILGRSRGDNERHNRQER